MVPEMALKTLFGVADIFCGLTFIQLLQRNAIARTAVKNRVVKYSVYIELLLNVIPASIDLSYTMVYTTQSAYYIPINNWLQITSNTITYYAGRYVVFLCSVGDVLCALTYFMLLVKMGDMDSGGRSERSTVVMTGKRPVMGVTQGPPTRTFVAATSST